MEVRRAVGGCHLCESEKANKRDWRFGETATARSHGRGPLGGWEKRKWIVGISYSVLCSSEIIR
jgi:hypothetical protein